MSLFDTHTHLYLPEFEEDATSAVDRAIEAGVSRLMLPNVDLNTVEPLIELHRKYPDSTLMAMGLHPTEIGESYRADLTRIKNILYSAPDDFKAVGEIGIDLYWDKSFRKEQMEAFGEQVRWAVELDKPVIIHCREGLDETLEVLNGFDSKPKAVFHSFGGTSEDVGRILGTGDFYFGINGIVTFKNSKLRETIPAIPIDRLVLETDSPYLAPVPYRGKRNESAYIVKTAETVAATLGVTVDELAGITTANAKNLFGLTD